MPVGQLGSPSALSLVADINSLPAVAAAGAILAVNAALFTYSEYKSYQEKKHKEKIEAINVLYTAHLKQIVVPHIGKIHGFPPIFQLTAENKYESMHFTPAQVKDIGTNISHGADIALASYQECVRAAIGKLKEYYFSRKKGETINSNDITAGVLSYLMQMIESKCLNFLGYDYDIAYLDAICTFINAYSSQQNRPETARFSHLAPVYEYLLDAKQKLEKHKEVLSLEETVKELKDSCVNHSDRLIRTLVKMVANDSNTAYADTVAHVELKDGILRQHYIRSEILGIELRSENEIRIPDSIFQQWIKNLSDYYLKSLSTDSGPYDEKLQSPNDFFKFLDKAKATLGRKQFGIFKHDEIEEQLKLIRKVFKESGNFISTRYNKQTKKFELVTDSMQLIDRALVMAKLAKLAHEVISLQYLCSHFLKSIQLLGEIYVRNPRHFCKIFSVLDKLCVLIQDDVKNTMKAFTQLQQDNANNMQTEEKERFPHEVNNLLKSVLGEIKNLGGQVKDCRELAIKSIKPNSIKSVNQDMLQIATLISNMYFGPDEEEPEELEDTPESEEIEDVRPPQAKENDRLADTLNALTKRINARILEIQKTELARAGTYFKVYDALVIMKNKAIALSHETSATPERIDKANRTLQLAYSMVKETLAFLNLPTAERQANAKPFFNKMHNQFADPKNAFIDRHYNPASAFIYTHLCSQGMFRTDTRKKLEVFEEACLKASYN